ncbi:MAG: glycosyltransferase family 1 protein [Planctomycetes bacterium]|nr:glycosyltransferase family 1 protein [Planctomycetota bacterium]
MIRSAIPSDREHDADAGGPGGGGALLPGTMDLVCLSHLRWDFVFQRPQHLLSRFARHHRVYVIEEPIHDVESPEMRLRREGNLTIVVPHLPPGLGEQTVHELLRSRLTRLLADEDVNDFALWYYTPMALPFSDHLNARVVVYDCMDELSAFRGAPPEMLAREAQLIERADLVFTGGLSLYEAKRDRHHSVHAFPSSIEYDHFAAARGTLQDPADQAGLPSPRIGFYGVVDERFDVDLLGQVASARPDWQFVILGPVVKIDPATLPRSANVHYLGQKGYKDLPAYLSGWDVAILPFARNESTRFISPTKTPEYLAAGRPVVSTPITDVVRPYGNEALVHIAEDSRGWVAAIEKALAQRTDEGWLARVDSFLAGNSWDETWTRMSRLMAGTLHARATAVANA